MVATRLKLNCELLISVSALFIFFVKMQRQFFCAFFSNILQVFINSFVRKVKRVGVVPVFMCNVLQAVDNMPLHYFDGQLPPFIKTSCCEINGANNCTVV